MKRRYFTSLCVAAALALAAPAHAAVKEKAVSSSRITVGDLIENVPGEIADIDLGPAPQPGSTRLLKRDEIKAALPEGTRNVSIPKEIRVSRKTKQLKVTDIEKMTRTAIDDAGLPKGVTLKAVKPRAAVTVPDGFDDVQIELPRLPRKEGKVTTTATLVLSQEEEELAKLTVTVELDLSALAAMPDAKKGEKGTLVISRGEIEIQAAVTVNEDADLGDVVRVTVTQSNKVLRCRLASAQPAIFEEVP